MAWRSRAHEAPEASAGPTVQRYRRPAMTDVRWVVGVLLLALGVIGTLRVIAASDDSVEVWSTRTALVPGQHVTAADLVRTKVRLNTTSGHYLRGVSRPDGVVQRAVGAGELLPRAALGSAASVGVRTIAVTLDRAQADLASVGSDVEVWVAAKADRAGSTSYAKPTRVIAHALVSHVGTRSSGVVAVSEGQPVEIVVPEETLPDVIDAVNSGSRVTLVPVAGSARP